ncbi:MAG: SH3 domain-containing protein, partial [Thermomicrobiales bacterium]
VGPSVLRNLANLGEGAEINVVGQDGSTYTYAVEDIERITVADLTPEDLENIVGETDYEALTIITCGGEFNYDSGEYLQRDIVRARLVSTTPAGGEAVAATETEGEEAPAEGEEAPAEGQLAAGGTATIVENGVNVRSEPSTSGDVVTSLASGETVTITGEAQDADGYTWWPVETGDGSTGWIVADFLQP